MQIFTFILVQFNTIPFSPLVHAVDGTLKGRFVLMFINDILAWCHPQTLWGHNHRWTHWMGWVKDRPLRNSL